MFLANIIYIHSSIRKREKLSEIKQLVTKNVKQDDFYQKNKDFDNMNLDYVNVQSIRQKYSTSSIGRNILMILVISFTFGEMILN